MAHIHTQPGQYDFTASAYIVLLQDNEEPKIWVHQHKKIGKWMQFGGHVELRENTWQTLTHEVKEESGYDLDQLKILQPLERIRNQTETATLHPQPINIVSYKFPGIDHYHTDMGFAFVTSEMPRHAIGDGESEVSKLMTSKELKSLTEAEIPVNVRDACLFILETILTKWEQVDCHEF